MVAWQDEDGPKGGVREVVVRRRPRRATRAARWTVLAFFAVILLGALLIWSQRKPLADNVIAKELAKRGVTATYKLDRIGLRTQEISDLVVGNPANPDLVAKKAVVQMRIGLDGGVSVYRILARGVRLNARVEGGRLRFGQVDRLLPPSSGKPFTLPNLVVDVADTTMRIDTPYGVVGLALAGNGNLSGGFAGHLSAASHRLAPGKCIANGLKASVALRVEARHPHIVGPVSATDLSCPQSRLTIDSPAIALDSRFTEGFDRATGSGRLTADRMVLGSNGLKALDSRIHFNATPKAVAGTVDLASRSVAASVIGSDRARFNGAYRFDLAAGSLAVDGDFASSGSRIDGAAINGLTAPLKSARKSPVGPIAERSGSAIARLSQLFEAQGHLSLVNFPGGGGVRIADLSAGGRDGARLSTSGADGIRYFWPSGKYRFNTTLMISGGGLPQARIDLRQPSVGARLSGEAEVAPYVVANSSLRLAPVRFGPSSDGGTVMTTVALLDGPFPGGRVTGLRLPIEARFGGASGLRIGQGCVDARFATLAVGALRLGASRVPLCPTNGASLISRKGDGRLLIGMATRSLRLRGSLGRSPFSLDAARAEFVGEDHFAANGLAVRMGRPDAPVLIGADRFDGTFVGDGARGQFGNGSALIGKVPLRLSDMAGRWTFAKGRLAIDGAATLSDMAEPARFYPLRSNDLRFTLADNQIRTTGSLVHPATGTKVSDVEIRHDLRSGNGAARLDVPGIRFSENGLQPDALTRLSEGVIALVNGTVSGQGRISWNGAGQVRSNGEFDIRDTNLAAAFGPVTGLNTTVRFTDLLNLETEAGGTLSMATVNPGILVENGAIRYQLLPGQLVRIERGEWPFMGGTLVLQETILNFARPSPKRLTFEVIGFDAEKFVQTMGFKEIYVSGVFDGVLPMIFDDEGGRIVGGRLDSRAGGGILEYRGAVSKADLGTVGSLAFDALKHLRYRSMIVRLDGNLDGEFATRLTVDQVALGETTTARFLKAINKVPFKFNVSIVGPFRALIGTAKSFRDPQPVISDVLPMALDQIPGATVEVRRTEEDKDQSQEPVAAAPTSTPRTKPKPRSKPQPE